MTETAPSNDLVEPSGKVMIGMNFFSFSVQFENKLDILAFSYLRM
jgi:hypothetical protein